MKRKEKKRKEKGYVEQTIKGGKTGVERKKERKTWNETKRDETKRNKTKQNETKRGWLPNMNAEDQKKERNQTKPNEIKRNGM